MRRQATFLGKTIGREVIEIPVSRRLVDLDESFAHAAPEIRVGQPECDTRASCQMALGDVAAGFDGLEYLERQALFSFPVVHNPNTSGDGEIFYQHWLLPPRAVRNAVRA